MFNKDFVWGCASSAFQMEGALTEGGRGRSIWDTFSETPGKIWGNCKPEPGCDFYHKYKEDIDIMKDMGIKAYRFSLSWSRILPEGTGYVNPEGLKFYSDVIDELLKNGIEPYITMYHWDLPEALQEKGGWVNPEIINWFAEYASVISKAYSDRVTNFITLNEPQCFSGISFLHGDHAPAVKLDFKDQFLQVHNMLRAHGAAVRALRANAKRKINVGYAPTCGMPYPATETPADIEAARRVLFTCPDDMSNWTWQVAWFSDPVFLGHYPEDGLKKYAEYLPEITDEDMKLISEPLDFMGENIYNGYAIRMGANGEPEYVDRDPGYAITGNDWPMTPQCFKWGLKYLYERYNMPIFVTENGTCCRDWVSLDGRVHDPMRTDFLNRYIIAMDEAMRDGVDIRGYFVWTLTDNFEWNLGYRDRFGLVFIDFTNGRRIRKDSSYFYEDVIKMTLTSGARSIRNELMNFYNYKKTVTTSAYCQQRSKIKKEAFKDLFYSFNSVLQKPKNYRGYRLLACDGSQIQTPMITDNEDYYLQGYQSSDNNTAYFHLNALYDLCNNYYDDVIIEPEHIRKEKDSLIKMVQRHADSNKIIYIADRGYESYNVMAHIYNQNQFFLIRIKDFNIGGIAQMFPRPVQDEFDHTFTRTFTRHSHKEYREKYGNYIWIRHKYDIDFFTPEHDMYEMTFRIIRIKISDDTYECIVTNLSVNEFKTDEIKALYHMRWGIETSFKELKYSTAMLYFHSRKEELLHQEIYAKLIMYNFSQAVISKIELVKKHLKYEYKINHALAEQLCSLFLRGATSIDVESILQSALLPVRPNRSYKRTKKKNRHINLEYRP